ncbi:hypothetical protein Q9G87_25475 [Nonomuraea sp. G32]|nr:hypothetical protein [Nonomuraea sp. G32]MDP4505342.1 hypothetical protein [Nonomuraea sp. G32]
MRGFQRGEQRASAGRHGARAGGQEQAAGDQHAKARCEYAHDGSGGQDQRARE